MQGVGGGFWVKNRHFGYTEIKNPTSGKISQKWGTQLLRFSFQLFAEIEQVHQVV